MHAAVTPPAITSPARVSFAEDSAVSFRITAKPTANTRLSEQGALPPGVTFTAGSDGTALLSGRATTPGTFEIIVKASSTTGGSTEQALILIVTQPPTITSGTTANFTAGTAANFVITTTGTPPATLSEQGTIPAGLAFHANANGTATIAGTPTQPGDFPVTITAQNGQVATQQLWLIVTQAPTVTSAATATFTTGSAGSFIITASGTPTPALSEQGALPAGLTFQPNTNGTATIAGTPTRAGDDPITVIASNSVGAAFTQNLNVEVAQPPLITTSASATFTRRVAGTFTIAASGWPAPALSVQGPLPPGLTFKDNGNGTASLSGTPTQNGTYNLGVTADNHISAPTVEQVNVAVTLTPTSVKLSLRRMGESATEDTLGLVAVVDPPGAVPTGRVTFFDRSGKLGSAKLDSLGAATLIVKVPMGDHDLSASYRPSAGSGFAPSTSASFGYVAAPARALSTNSGSLSSTGTTVRRALEIGAVLVLLVAAAAAATVQLRRRRPRRSV